MNMAAEITRDQEAVDAEFNELWIANEFSQISDIIGQAKVLRDEQIANPEQFASAYKVTEVTLRDGQQQETDPKIVPTEDRVEVFKQIVRTGVDRIEIGHLGNKVADQDLARELVKLVAVAEQDDDEDTAQMYGNVKLQVLFSSHKGPTQDGLSVLQDAFQESYGDGWQEAMADKVVVHVYDRVGESLRQTSSTYYTSEQSAERISEAAQLAIDAGITKFSVSGEAATDVSVADAIQFHRSIDDYLFSNGAEEVNVNLANTFGVSPNPVWNASTMSIFNHAVKHGYEDKVSTSIHTHNDGDSIAFTMSALAAGFDRIDSTLFGMGERLGNVPVIDVNGEILQLAHQEIASETIAAGKIVEDIGRIGMSRVVQIDETIVKHLGDWFDASRIISDIFGKHSHNRFYHTKVADPDAHNNGSGPHDQAIARAIMDPVAHPPYLNYESTLPRNDILGRPGADKIAIADPEAVDSVTIGNHAGGGYTQKIKSGELTRPDDLVAEAIQHYERHKEEIIARAIGGVLVVAA
jgi:isopropylmalate/homocitrate/citramalate synthase